MRVASGTVKTYLRRLVDKLNLEDMPALRRFATDPLRF
jgi:hypothetical protein